MRRVSDYERFDSQRVSRFLDELNGLTWKSTRQGRTEEIDKRIGHAELSLADKIEAFKRLAATGWTSDRDELRMERLLCSVAREDLSVFKYALEYDGDYKDLEEYLCHDIDSEGCRARVIEHLRTAPREDGVKVLSDVDDTMYANLIDERYPRRTPKKAFYPGILEFYDALKREPFTLEGIPVTTLSARPNPVAGISEEGSLGKLVEYSDRRLRPSALSGELCSSTIGTLQTFVRAKLGSIVENIPHGKEDEIGVVKFENFANFAAVYPEYRYVFVGDSGQADALTAQLLLTTGLAEGSSRVITTFVHDLRQFDEDERSVSPAFRGLRADLIIERTSPTGRGVIVFRNYIEAAIIAYMHSESLGNLITADSLARITRAALRQFQAIDFQAEGKEGSGQRLRKQYREDAEEACTLLTLATPGPLSREEDVTGIRRLLEEESRPA